MNELLALAAALLALRLAGSVAHAWRVRRTPDFAAWAVQRYAPAIAQPARREGASVGASE